MDKLTIHCTTSCDRDLCALVCVNVTAGSHPPIKYKLFLQCLVLTTSHRRLEPFVVQLNSSQTLNEYLYSCHAGGMLEGWFALLFTLKALDMTVLTSTLESLL